MSHDLWLAIFDNAQPVELEIGPGTGTFLLEAAAARPDVNFFGIEHSQSRTKWLRVALDDRRLTNVRVICADAACVVSTLIPPASVQAYHIYFPDPWWKRRHHRRRLFTPSFAGALARTLVSTGRLYVATDVDDVFALIRATVRGSSAFSDDPTTPAPPLAVSSFERKGLARGATIKRATFSLSDLRWREAAPITAPTRP